MGTDIGSVVGKVVERECQRVGYVLCFLQAEDGIRDLVRSRGLGDVYKRQVQWDTSDHDWLEGRGEKLKLIRMMDDATSRAVLRLSLIHI